MSCDCHDEIQGYRSEIDALRSALAQARAALRKLHHTEKGTCAFNLRGGSCEFCALLSPPGETEGREAQERRWDELYGPRK
jgi:hypothetical protein